MSLEIVPGGEVGDEPVESDALSQLEAAVLGAMILDGTVSAELAPSDFGDRRHRPIFQAMRAVAADTGSVDAIAVVRWLEAHKRLSEAGGETYIIEMIDAATLGDVPRGVQTIRRESIRRRALARLERGENPAAVASWMTTAVGSEQVAPPTYRTLGDYLDDPEILKPPAVIVPRLLWRKRLTMLAAEEKLGKSTLMAAGAAAASAGKDFLNESTQPAVIAYVTIDEPVGSTVANLHRFSGDRGRLVIVTDAALGTDRLQGVANAVRWLAPDGTLIDSLWKLSAGKVERSGDAASWGPVLDALTSIAHDYATGVLFSHHSRKSDGKYRDSSAIGAAVDMILEMGAGDAGARKIEARGRWSLEDFEVRLHGDTKDYAAPMYYALASGGDLSLDTRILLFIENHPGCTMRTVLRGVSGRTEAKLASIRALIARGAVEDCGSESSGSQLFAKTPGNAWETPRETPPRFP